MRLQHVQADHANDSAQSTPVDRFLARRHEVRDEVSVSFELLSTFQTRIHAESMHPTQVLHHLFDGEIANVAQVTGISSIEGFDAKLVKDFAARVDVDILFGFFVGNIFHVYATDFRKKFNLRVLAQAPQEMVIMRHL